MNDSTTAYHEAGHALIAYLHDIETLHLTIASDEGTQTAGSHVRSADYLPEVEDGRIDDAENFTRFLVTIMVSLGGHEAVCLLHDAELLPEDWGASDGWGSGADYEMVTQLVERVTYSEQEGDALVAWLRVRTRRMLQRHRVLLDAVAAALLERQTLDADEFRRVIVEAGIFSHSQK